MKNNEIARKLLSQGYISKKTKRKLLINTAQAPRPRATPKLHKPRIRVINNAINSPTYNMSRYLNEILTKISTGNKYNVKNSFELKVKLDKLSLQPDDIMVSFDIVSMYEKIPTKLVYKSLQKR